MLPDRQSLTSAQMSVIVCEKTYKYMNSSETTINKITSFIQFYTIYIIHILQKYPGVITQSNPSYKIGNHSCKTSSILASNWSTASVHYPTLKETHIQTMSSCLSLNEPHQNIIIITIVNLFLIGHMYILRLTNLT